MLSFSELEFTCEQEHIEIVPKISLGRVYLISGVVGPFEPGVPTKVPLWLALNLRQREKCRIVPPTWLTADKLEEIKQRESENPLFQQMPSPYYRELSQFLLTHTSMDIPNADQISILLKDIWDVRMAKLRSSITAFFRSDEAHAKVDNLTVFEMNTVRDMLTKALEIRFQMRCSEKNKSL